MNVLSRATRTYIQNLGKKQKLFAQRPKLLYKPYLAQDEQGAKCPLKFEWPTLAEFKQNIPRNYKITWHGLDAIIKSIIQRKEISAEELIKKGFLIGKHERGRFKGILGAVKKDGI